MGASKLQRLMRQDTIVATIKNPCAHFHGCWVALARHSFENEL